MSIGARLHDFGCASAPEMARRVSDAGFECVQLALNKAIEGVKPEYGHMSPGFANGIRRAFDNRGIEVAVLGCYIDPACPDEEKRLKEVERYNEHIAYCRMLGSNIVGTETSNCTDDIREEQYKRLLRSISSMAEQAEHFGVFMGIEPVFVHTLNTPKMAGRMLKDIASRNVQIILDPINLLHTTNIDRQREIIDEAFEVFGDRIVAVHAKDIIYDANGSFTRCVIGEGLFDSAYFYKQLSFCKPGISVLCEETSPEICRRDIAALKSML